MDKEVDTLIKMSKKKELEMLKTKSRKEIIEMFIPIARVVAFRLIKKYRSFREEIDRDDLISISILTMIEFIDRYKPEKCKLNLSYYLYNMIFYRVCNFFRYSDFTNYIKQIFPIPHSLRDDDDNAESEYFEKMCVHDLLDTINRDNKLMKTPYQNEIKDLMIQGYSNKEISQKLKRSYGAISQNKLIIKQRICRKYGYMFKDLFKK